MGLQFGFGSGLLYGTRTDIANSTPVRFGAMQDVSIDFDGEIKELYAQSQYAIDAARGKTKIQGKAKFAQINATVFNNLYFGGTLNSGQNLTVYNEAHTTVALTTDDTSAATLAGSAILTFAAVPAGVTVGALVVDVDAGAAIPFGTTVLSKTATTVTLSANVAAPGVGSGDTINFTPPVTPANTATWAGDLGVYFAATGNALTYVTTLPSATGEYYEQDGLYYFAPADNGLSVLLNYVYTSVSGLTIVSGNPFMGTTPKFIAVFNQVYNGQQTTLKLFSAVANKLTLPTKIDDYVINEIDFMAYQNAAGSVFELSTAA